VEAAAVPASVVAAAVVVQKWVQPGDCVLVLGATGVVGSHVVQLLKSGGASFVAATAQKVNRLDATHVDRMVDYTKENWWEIQEFKASRFDLILDFAAFPNAWANSSSVLKTGWEGGRFITTAGDTPYFSVLGVCDVCVLLKRMFCRTCWTSCAKSAPKYCWFMGGLSDPISEEIWTMVFKAIEEKQLKVCVDPSGPFHFTEKVSGKPSACRQLVMHMAKSSFLVSLRADSLTNHIGFSHQAVLTVLSPCWQKSCDCLGGRRASHHFCSMNPLARCLIIMLFAFVPLA